MNKPRFLLLTLSLLGWFAIISQLYLSIENRIYSVPETIVNFFSYFTILTNIIVAICVTSLLLGKSIKLTNAKSITAIAVYITIVGITYNLLLRSTWNPQGLQKVTDELLHTVIPILFVIYWFVYAKKAHLKWSDAFPWLIYPVIYSLYTLVHGVSSNWYPYPFINPINIGWNAVVINSILVIVAFFVVSLLFIAVSRSKTK